jgi:hypothetical protein
VLGSGSRRAGRAGRAAALFAQGSTAIRTLISDDELVELGGDVFELGPQDILGGTIH